MWAYQELSTEVVTQTINQITDHLSVIVNHLGVNKRRASPLISSLVKMHRIRKTYVHRAYSECTEKTHDGNAEHR